MLPVGPTVETADAIFPNERTENPRLLSVLEHLFAHTSVAAFNHQINVCPSSTLRFTQEVERETKVTAPNHNKALLFQSRLDGDVSPGLS